MVPLYLALSQELCEVNQPKGVQPAADHPTHFKAEWKFEPRTPTSWSNILATTPH